MSSEEKAADDDLKPPVGNRLDELENEISGFHEYCIRKGFDLDSLEHLTDPIFANAHRVQFKPVVKIFALLVFILSSAFFLLTFSPLHRLFMIYARYFTIQLLPYWDWTSLYYKECLLNNPFFERNKLITEDCQVCESLEFIERLSNVTHTEISEDYLKSDIPVIISDAMLEWPVMTDESFSIRNITDIFIQHKDSEDFIPCSFLTNIRIHGEDVFKGFLKKLTFHEVKRWFAHWENCEKQASKALRHLYHRPYFLPALVDTSEPNWVFVSSNYRSRNYKEVQLPSDMMWIGQIRGRNHIRLTPQEPCGLICPQLHTTLFEGEILLFTDLMWKFEYIPDEEEEENIAFANGGFWEI